MTEDGREDQARRPRMPAVRDARPGRRVVDAADPPRRLRRLHPLRRVPSQPRHLVEPAHQPAQATRRQRTARTSPVPGAPTAPRIRTDRPRSLTPTGHRRPRRLGQRPPRTRRHAAWCSSTPKPASKPNPSSSTEHPADASTDPTSSSPPGRPRASRSATATKAAPARTHRRVAAASRAPHAILERVRAIPRGSVRTYSEIDPEAPRVVGRVLATTHEKVPWHRVVRADGSAPMGADQLALLRKERVPMRGDRVDLSRAPRRE